jgi:hypothetical protein
MKVLKLLKARELMKARKPTSQQLNPKAVQAAVQV